MSRVIAFTGHRPSKLPDGWAGPHIKVFLFLLKELLAAESEERITLTISGGALGWDQIALEASKQAGMCHLLAEPFPYFWRKWKPDQIEEYLKLKHTELEPEHEDEIIQVNPDEDYSAWKLHARNEYMVNRATEIWAWWDGTRKGGTYACLQYAYKKDIKIVNLYKKFHGIE